MSKGSVTIADIAKEVGLSKTTVADALGGAGRVAEPTRRRVAEVARRLGYASNRAAKSLRSGKNGAIGIYIPQAVRQLSFYMQFAFGAADSASADGNDLTLLAVPRPHRGIASLHIDGAIVVDPVPGDIVSEHLFASQLPIVSVGTPVEPAGPDIAVIRIPYETVVPAFLDQWVGSDRQPIAFIVPDDTFTTPWRRDIHAATSNWSNSRGVELDEFKLPVVPSDTELRAALKAITTAESRYGRRLLVAPEMVAGRSAGILDQLTEDGWVIASLSGDPGTELSNPRIDALDLGAHRFGEQAARFLHDILAGTAQPGSERLFEIQVGRTQV